MSTSDLANKSLEELQKDLKEANKKALIFSLIGAAAGIFLLWAAYQTFASMPRWMDRGESDMFIYALIVIVGAVVMSRIKGPMEDAQYMVKYLQTEISKRK